MISLIYRLIFSLNNIILWTLFTILFKIIALEVFRLSTCQSAILVDKNAAKCWKAWIAQRGILATSRECLL